MWFDRQALELTLRVRGRAIDNRVVRTGRDRLPDAPIRVDVRRVDGNFVVAGPEGEVVANPHAHLAAGGLEIDAAPVRRFRLVRWVFDQGHAVLPLLTMAVSLAGLQLQLLLMLVFGGGASGGAYPEPSPELIARLLEEQYDGADRGLAARPTERPRAETKVESYYLQPGSAGPAKRLGGGQDVAKERQDGKLGASPQKAVETVPVQELGDSAEPPEPEQVAVADAAEPTPTEGEDEAPAVEVTEGWGLTDWYDTEDARRDAEAIKQQLEYAQQLLRIDPDDLYALQIRSYYEYLAMDFDRARRTYDHMLEVDPKNAATWNNLALVHKREKDYVKEEELYRVSLEYGPDDPNTLNNLAVCVAHQGRYDEALALMKRVEGMTPDDPYADLHRAKIYAMMGKEELSYRFLRKSLGAMRKLDTLHNIEFQQDIRVDPAFESMRQTDRFRKLLLRFYGEKKGGWWMIPGKP